MTRLVNILKYSLCDASTYLYLSIVEAVFKMYILYRFELSLGITTLNLLANLLVFGLLFGEILGLNGIWLGFAAAATVAMSAAFIKYHYSQVSFPLLLDNAALGSQVTFDVWKTAAGAVELLEKVKLALDEQQTEPARGHTLIEQLEKTLAVLLQKFAGKRALLECTLLFAADITAILRDSAGEAAADDSSMREHSRAGGADRLIFHV